MTMEPHTSTTMSMGSCIQVLTTDISIGSQLECSYPVVAVHRPVYEQGDSLQVKKRDTYGSGWVGPGLTRFQ